MNLGLFFCGGAYVAENILRGKSVLSCKKTHENAWFGASTLFVEKGKRPFSINSGPLPETAAGLSLFTGSSLPGQEFFFLQSTTPAVPALQRAASPIQSPSWLWSPVSALGFAG